MDIEENIIKLRRSLPKDVTLVAVSKTKPIEDIEIAYKTGQRDFGENKVQDLIAKKEDKKHVSGVMIVLAILFILKLWFM